MGRMDRCGMQGFYTKANTVTLAKTRIEELEAKLAKAVLALQLIDAFTNTHDQRAVAIEMLEN
jgi:hypothetical protein